LLEAEPAVATNDQHKSLSFEETVVWYVKAASLFITVFLAEALAAAVLKVVMVKEEADKYTLGLKLTYKVSTVNSA